ARYSGDRLVRLWQAHIDMGQTEPVDRSIELRVDISLIKTRAGTGGTLAIGRGSQIAPENLVPGSPAGPRKAVGSFQGPGLPPPFLRVPATNQNNPNKQALEGLLRYVRTNTLTPEVLGYESTIRPALEYPFTALDQQIDTFPKIKVKETNSLLVSDISSGAWSVVKLGSFNGRPVAMRWSPKTATETSQQYQERQLQSIRGSQFLSDLGVGPKLHGLYTNTRGEVYEVTDIVPGDHYDAVGEGRVNPAMTERTFDDLEEILERFESVGLSDLFDADAQYYLTPHGRLLAIDGGQALDGLDPLADAHPNRVNGSFTMERCDFLQYASEKVGKAYMDKLRTEQPSVWSTLVLTLHERLQGPRPPLGLERHLPYAAQHLAEAKKLNES
ncbi:MAG: hypothetical protein RL341_2277, partial [Pseudomonadota bacterium]